MTEQPTSGLELERVLRNASTAERQREAIFADKPALRELHHFILKTFAATGQPPTVSAVTEKSRQLALDPAAAIGKLSAMDLIVLSRLGNAVQAAYPFSAVPTPHRVSLEAGPTTYANCAVDALGIPFMLDRDAVITSAEPVTGREIHITMTGGQARWEPDTATMFAGTTGCGGQALDRACGFINFFTSQQAASDWSGARKDVHGWVLDQEDALKLAKLSFARLLSG